MSAPWDGMDGRWTTTPSTENPIEPSALRRRAAHELREMYVALVSEGFSPAEAMQIIGNVISSGLSGGQK